MSPHHGQQDSEEAFLKDWLDVLDVVRQLRARGERGGYAIPMKMRAILGEDRPESTPGITVRPIRPPQGAPLNLKPDWVWVPVNYKQTLVKSVVKALLRLDGTPVPVRKIIEKLQELRSDVVPGTVANIGTALTKEGLIERGEDGWRILSPEKAPEIADGFLYGPVDVFAESEIAWFRREAILHLLGVMPGGLQPQQIVEHLGTLDWVPEPKSKDIVKMDVEALAKDKRIRRAGTSKKWEIRPEGGRESV